ncbi:CinA family protein [Puerhibacterium sp. TATVAM-FAB25]|uniref:CinA family protein n=1 Tax=Puerhibacterium sp. TATVAM-FAB25 TaxID=3093699 RepID=UPI003979B7D9
MSDGATEAGATGACAGPGTSAARQVLAAAAARGLTLGVAESLTGGLVVAALVGVPGASAVLRGGVVAYATDLKAALLGVDADLLAARGAVDPDVAAQMALGVRRVTGADVGLATTGVAGPDPQDGHPPGLVYVAVAAPRPGAEVEVRRLDLRGARPAVRAGAVAAVLGLAVEVL